MATMLVTGFAACGQASSSPNVPAHDATAMMHNAAVQLVFAEVNATALPRAYDRKVLRKRMRRYVTSAWLDRRVATRIAAIETLGGPEYTQAWLDAITVGQWEADERHDHHATVVFLAYETVTAQGLPTDDLPIERFTVRMHREHGKWRLTTYDKHWLTPAGPMAAPGSDDIDSLPERTVFRNPRENPRSSQ